MLFGSDHIGLLLLLGRGPFEVSFGIHSFLDVRPGHIADDVISWVILDTNVCIPKQRIRKNKAKNKQKKASIRRLKSRHKS
jgi:hypothetical protein